MSNLSLGKDGEKFIKSHEGFSLSFYGDPKGYPTVGWGHLITSSKVYTKNTTGDPADSLLTQAEADALSRDLKLSYTSPITTKFAQTLFDDDTERFISAVNKLELPNNHKFSQNQFDALVSLAFNCGEGVLRTNDVVTMLASEHIYGTFIGPLTEEQLDACSKLVSNAFSYDRSLKDRRNAEATLFCKGHKYSHKYPVYSLK